jgi:Mn-dependent DtxR family transcriptional regulator
MTITEYKLLCYMRGGGIMHEVLDLVAKMKRPKNIVARFLEKLCKKKFIKKVEGCYTITPEGQKALKNTYERYRFLAWFYTIGNS